MATTKNRNGSEKAVPKSITELLNAIYPRHSPALSANLYRWMRRHGRAGDTVYRLEADCKFARIYGAGTVFLGQPYTVHVGDTDFSGVLLMAVLCSGTSATRVCHEGLAPSLVEVSGFWDRYKIAGRCAIDEKHAVGFRDDAQRFEVKDGQQICTWCAASVPQVKTEHSAAP
ncbi:hypothetical protein K5D56_21495 [Pseudomonas cichorii]|nr:hypothetical protein [Pseudomonas cichorii]MBX8557040.1 hypothetical protein [Pseudomonas cichorii]MBX8591944.1 hypothetical protein [Pseudomonas cichorii]